MNTKLSPNFTRKEFECPHCQQLTIDMRLVSALEELRALVKKPLVVTSAYRCPEHNARVGGAQASEHVRGLAADVLVPKGLTLADFYQKVDTIALFKNGGVGVYPEEGFLHLDIRGKRARWSRINNTYIGLDEGLAKGTIA